jgi:hypothetical protein
MKSVRRQHLVAAIFPASMLGVVRAQSERRKQSGTTADLVFLTGNQPATIRRVRMVAEEFSRRGKSIRVTRTL